MSAILLLLALEVVKIALLRITVGIVMPGILGLLLFSIAGILFQLTQLYFYLILIVVVMSWINPMSPHPAMELLRQLTEPLLLPVRRMIPSLGGFDLSPIAVLIAIKLIGFLVIYPLQNLAGQL